MNRSGGYMLLEVILALSIFIIAVVGLLQCLNAAIGADYLQQRETNVRLNLQSLLDESLAKPPIEEKTDFPEDKFHIRYRREITPVRVKLNNGKDLKDIYQITTVAMDTRKDNKIIGELWTYASR